MDKELGITRKPEFHDISASITDDKGQKSITFYLDTKSKSKEVKVVREYNSSKIEIKSFGSQITPISKLFKKMSFIRTDPEDSLKGFYVKTADIKKYFHIEKGEKVAKQFTAYLSG